MNATEDDECASRTGEAANRVSSESVASVNAYADDIARSDLIRIKRFQRLIDDDGRAEAGGRRCRQHVQPPGRDDGRPEGQIAGIDQMHAHVITSPSRRRSWQVG